MFYVLLSSSFVDKLTDVLTKIFNQVLSPILTDILTVICNLIGNVIWTMLGDLFLTVLIAFCNMVDFVAGLFDIFSGVAPVVVMDGTARGTQKSLLNAFFELEQVSKAFLLVTLLAIGICFLFTIFSTAKSIAELALDDDAKPITKVLKSAAKSCVMFMLVPFMSITLLHISSMIAAQAESSLDQGKQASVGTILFLTGSLPAARSGYDSVAPGLDEGIWKDYMDGVYTYRDRDKVDKHFDSTRFDYVTSMACAVVLFFMLLGAVVLFIGRVFELLILYLVSPLFVSTIPGDDGAMFKKWRELFIAKFFSGFGCVFTMKFYLMTVPKFVDGTIDFGSGSGELDCIIKVFLVIGGAWAVFKGQHLLLQILNPAAADLAQQSTVLAAVMSMRGARGAIALAGGIGSGIGGKLKKAAKKEEKYQKKQEKEGLDESSGSGQAFKGKKV